MAKMMGRCGWWRRCSCCNHRKTNREIRSKERRKWRQEAQREIRDRKE